MPRKRRTPIWAFCARNSSMPWRCSSGSRLGIFASSGAAQANPPAFPLRFPRSFWSGARTSPRRNVWWPQANAQIGVAQAAYYPNVTLSASAGFGATSIADWFTWPSRFWSVGPALAETLFDAACATPASMQQSQALYDQTVANYRQTVLTAFQQVEDNLAALRILSQEIQQQDTAISLGAGNLAGGHDRYRAGIDPYLNVITAQTHSRQPANRGESAQGTDDRQRPIDRGARRRLGRRAVAERLPKPFRTSKNKYSRKTKFERRKPFGLCGSKKMFHVELSCISIEKRGFRFSQG